jgi:hypothetical protein
MTPYRGSPARYEDPGRAEIVAAVPAGSRRLCTVRAEKTYLAALTADPELAARRPVFREHVLDVAKQLARHASYRNGTTRPTRARICALARVSQSTWKAARRWLQAFGWLGVVREGWTSRLRPMALQAADPLPDQAAVYVVCVPKPVYRSAVAAACGQSRPLTQQACLQGSSPRATPPGDNPVDGPPSGRTQPLRPVAGQIRTASGALAPRAHRCGPGLGRGVTITDGWCAHLAGPFEAAGWSPRDVQHAIDHDPDGVQHRHPVAGVRHPAAWLRARLARWLEPGDGPWKHRRPRPSRSQVLAAAAAARKLEQAARRAARSQALAAAEHGPARAAQIRQQLGWPEPKENP